MAGANLSETGRVVAPSGHQPGARGRSAGSLPIALFVLWRLAHLGVTVFHGSDPGDSALTWDAQACGRILRSGYDLDPG
jgi:hypothetical protein